MGEVSLLIIALLLVATFLRVDFIFYIVYVLVGIYLWSRWFTPRAFKRVRFERRFADHAFLNERVRVALVFHNKGRLPLPWLQLKESVPPELVIGRPPAQAFTLRGGEQVFFHYEIQATRRGYYRLGPLFLRAGDLFGWNEEQAQSDSSYLTVYPRIIPLSDLGLPSRLPFGTIASQQRLFEDPARPVGVRNYRSGDSLRQINWKVSAHRAEIYGNHLMVKTLQPAISLDTAILLNLNTDEYSRRERWRAPEWAIEVAASLAAHLVERQQAVGLMSNGNDPLQRPARAREMRFDEVSGRLLTPEDAGPATMPPAIPPRTGRAHLMKILEQLARIEPRATRSFASWIPQACLHLSWGVTIPTITASGEEGTLQALHRLVRAGFNPVLIVVSPNHRFGQIRERARQLGFSAYLVTDVKDLDEWRRPLMPGSARRYR